MCDGIQDCPEGEDELGCTCSKTDNISTQCKSILGGGKKHCSSWFLRQRKGSCKFVYFSQMIPQGSAMNNKDNNPVVQQKSSCKSMGAFSCKGSLRLCFYFYDVCVYKLHNNLLTPCPLGTHMQYCKNFECNIMFKCPESYCIPWKYVCDNVWDCQQGEEESVVHCDSEQRCQGMFRCLIYHTTQLCIHLGNVCDQEEDCPYGEETFCVLSKIVCPILCHCHVFAISCEGVKVASSTLRHFSVYQLLFMKNVTVQMELCLTNSALLVSMILANLTSVCVAPNRLLLVRSLDFTLNQISSLTPQCFQSFPECRFLTLAENKISEIMANSFFNLTQLIFLNLSANNLIIISSSSFQSLTHFSFLSIVGNNVSHPQIGIFKYFILTLLQTDQWSFCCMVPSTTLCTFKFAWYQSCADLLPTVVLRCMFYIVSAMILSFNANSLLLQKCVKTETKTAKAFGVCAISVTLCDLLYCIPFIIIWGRDISFRGFFHTNETVWKSSFLCFLAYFVFLNYSFLSPALLSFVSLSRAMVVMYPMKSTFKNAKLLKAVVFCIVMSACILSTVITILTRVMHKSVPFQFCTPFVDLVGSLAVVKYSVLLQAVIKIPSVVFIFSLYILVVKTILNQQKLLQDSISRKASNFSMFLQIFVLNSSNILCWVPSSIVFLQSIFSPSQSIDIILWTTIIVTPLNSVVNPVVFSATTMKKFITTKKCSWHVGTA